MSRANRAKSSELLAVHRLTPRFFETLARNGVSIDCVSMPQEFTSSRATPFIPEDLSSRSLRMQPLRQRTKGREIKRSAPWKRSKRQGKNVCTRTCR